MNHSAIYVIIVCSFLIRNSIIEADSYLYHVNSQLQTTTLSLAVTHAVAYLLYPLLGWLSDVYFTRYKVIRLAFAITCAVGAGSLALAIAAVLDNEMTTNLGKSIIALLLALPMLLLWVLSLGLFEANAIQLGMDQLLEASSDRLSSFIHWYYWSRSLKHAFNMLVIQHIHQIQGHSIGLHYHVCSCNSDYWNSNCMCTRW